MPSYEEIQGVDVEKVQNASAHVEVRKEPMLRNYGKVHCGGRFIKVREHSDLFSIILGV